MFSGPDENWTSLSFISYWVASTADAPQQLPFTESMGNKEEKRLFWTVTFIYQKLEWGRRDFSYLLEGTQIKPNDLCVLSNYFSI